MISTKMKVKKGVAAVPAAVIVFIARAVIIKIRWNRL